MTTRRLRPLVRLASLLLFVLVVTVVVRADEEDPDGLLALAQEEEADELLEDNKGGADSILQVLSPASLIKPNGYFHRDALFGSFPFGSSLEGTLVYDADNLYCEPLVEALPDNTSIAFVDRGNCTFVTKIRHAQQAGAIAVVVADNECVCGQQACVPADPLDPCELNAPLMANDGTALEEGDVPVTLPALLLYKEDADPIKAYLDGPGDTTVEVRLEFPVPLTDEGTGVTDYGFWMVPVDAASWEAVPEFQAVVQALDETVTPHLHFWMNNGTAIHCTDNPDEGQEGFNPLCDWDCTNEGRYCLADPDLHPFGGLGGKDVVKETVTLQCLWQLYVENSEIDADDAPFWAYLDAQNPQTAPEHMTQDLVLTASMACLLNNNDDDESGDNQGGVACQQDLLTRAGVDLDLLDACLTDAGGLETGPNRLLEDMLVASKTVDSVPTWVVDGEELGGSLTAESLVDALCVANLDQEDETTICAVCRDCLEMVDCLQNRVCDSGSDGDGDGGEPAAPLDPAEDPNSPPDGDGVIPPLPQGDGDDESPPDPGEPGANMGDFGNEGDNDDSPLSMAVLMELVAAAGECNINVLELAATFGSLMPSGENDSGAGDLDLGEIADALSNLVEPVTQVCSATDETVFDQVLDQFEDCSQVDLQEFLETLPSAWWGTALHCLPSMAAKFDGSAAAAVVPEPLPAHCVESTYGHHAYGDMIRKFVLQPATMCDCLAEVHDTLPVCTRDLWPVPLVGPWMQTGTCLVHELCAQVPTMCDSELAALDACLPDAAATIQVSCDVVPACIQQGSWLLRLPPPLLGAPLPDACVQASMEQDVFEGGPVYQRYQSFLDACVSTPWEGWTRPFGRDREDPDGNVPPPPSDLEGAPPSPEPPATGLSSPTTEALKGPLQGFVIGFGVAMFLSLALYIRGRCKTGRRRADRQTYEGVETYTSDLELT